MSTTVDNRVVQMRFDNEEFEKKASKSLSTLDKLKNALKFSGASKKLDDVNKSFKEVDANPLLKAIEGINGGLTTMVAKATLVNRATNALIDTTKRFVNSMTLDQVNAGWDKYAEKTSAVQTIMAATSKDFKDTAVQMGYVNNQLEKLNWFTDETSYNFTDMVGNIGKFTSNGIKLDKSVTSMQGIALWAARSGANANEASRAMYNLSQALSTGAVKLIDWKSIENANMATAEFKENAIEAAVALGKLKKAGDGTYKTMKGNAVSVTNFNNALSDAWFTSDVLMNVLDKYGSFTNKLYEVSEATDLTATQLLTAIDKYAAGTLDLQAYANATGNDVEELRGYLDELSSSTYDLGRKSFQAGQEAKTFGEAIAATSDAVSTGWMKTFEIIFGDYEEAKKLWTNLANILYEVFATSGDVRNELFGEWREGGGRKTFLEGINESMEAILRLVTPIKDAFRDIFPAKTGQDLLNITNGFKKLMQSLQLNSKQMTNLRRIARGVFSVFDIFLTTIKSVGNAIKNLVAPQFATFGDLLLEILGTIGDLIYIFRNFIRSGDKLSASFGKIGNYASKCFEIIKKLFDQFRSSEVGRVSFKIIQNVFEGAAKAAANLLSYVKEVVSRIASLDHITFSNLVGIFKGIGSDAQNWFKDLDFRIGSADGILADFKQTVKDACDKTGASFENLSRRVAKVFTTIRSFLEDVPWGALISIFFGLKIIATINNFVKAMSTLATAIGNLTSGFGGLMTGVNKVLTSVAGVFDAVKSYINAPNYIKIAKSIAILAGSLTVLALLPTDKLEKAAVVLTAVMVVFAAFVKSLTLMPGLVATGATAVGILAKTIVALTAGILILTAAFKALESLDPNRLMDSVLTVIGIIGTLTTAVMLMNTKASLLTAVSGRTGILNSAAGNLLAMAGAVYIIAKTLKTIEDLSFSDINSVINGIVLSVTSVVALSYALSKIKSTNSIKGSIALITSVTAITAMLRVIKKLESYHIDNIWDIIKKLGLMMGALAALFAASNLAGKNAARAGGLMAGLGLGIYAILGAIALLGNMKLQTLEKGIAAVSILGIVMGGIIAITKLAGANAAKVSLTLLSAAAAISVLTIIAGIVGHLDQGAMMKGLAYVAGLSAIFIAMIAVTKHATDASKTITTMTVAAVALGTMIAALSFAVKDGPEKLQAVSTCLSMVMVTFGIMTALSKSAKVSLGSMAIVTAVIAGLATILGLLLTLSPNLNMAIKAASGVSILAAGLTVIMTTLPIAAATGALAGPALVGIGVALVALLGVTVTLGAILAVINALTIPDDLPDKCLLVGQAIGNLAGGFVGGIAGGVMSAIGEGIKAFSSSMESVNPEKVKAGLSCVIDFAKSLVVLAGTGAFVAFIGAPDLEKFKSDLGLLGESITAYSTGIQNADMIAVAASIPAVQALVTITNLLPKNGGLFNLFTGTQNLAGFGIQLAAFGLALTGYSLVVKACDNEAIAASIPGAQALVQIANTIPDFGIFGFLFGSQDLFVFGTQLVLFGDALRAYSDTVIGLDTSAIQNSVSAATALVDVANAIPDDGLIQSIMGKQGLDDFGKKVAEFGKSIAQYYANLQGISITNGGTSQLVADVRQLIAFVPEIQGLDLGSLTDFGTKIQEFGWNLWQFFASTNQVQQPTSLDILCQNVVQSADFINAYTDNFKKAGEDCVSGFLEGIAGNDALERVKNSGALMGNTFLTSFRGVTGWHSPWSTMIQAAKDAALGLFGGSDDPKASDAGQNIANNALDGYDKASSGQYAGKAANAAADLKAGADANVGTAEAAGEKIGGGFFSGIKNALSSVGDWIKEKTGLGDSDVDNYADKIANGLTDLSGIGFDTSETEKAASEVSNAIDNVVSSAVATSSTGSGSGSLKASGEKAADTFLTAFETKLSDLDLDLSTIDLEKELWDATIGQKASDADKNAKETEIIKQKIELQNEKVDQANQKYDYIVKKLGKTSEDAKKAYQELLQEQIDLANLLNQVNETQNSVADNSADAMVTYAQYIAESKDDLLKLGFTMEQISAAAAERTGYNLQNTTQNMTESVTGAVQTAMSTVSSTYAATAESTIGALTTNFEGYGVKYAESIGAGMSTTTSAVTAGAKTLSNAGETAISTEYKQWVNLGQMCAEGFKQGILSKAKEIADAARSVANAAFSAVQVAIDSHSPSRKFMWLGEMGGEGFAIGFENMSNRVAQSGEDMSQGAIDAARETIKQIAEVIDTDPTLHPQIAPVVDLSNVRGGLSRIGTMRTPVISTQVTGARVAAVASSIGSRQNTTYQPVPQNNQNGPQTIEFVQNNYSPKALSRSEIYRNTNNQFTAFKEAISRV